MASGKLLHTYSLFLFVVTMMIFLACVLDKLIHYY
jgi:hypothetical protein